VRYPGSPRRLHRLLPLRRRVLGAVLGSARRTRKTGRFQRLWDRFPTPLITRRFTSSLPALPNSQDVARCCELASPRLRLRQEGAESRAGAHAGSEPRRRDHGSRCYRSRDSRARRRSSRSPARQQHPRARWPRGAPRSARRRPRRRLERCDARRGRGRQGASFHFPIPRDSRKGRGVALKEIVPYGPDRVPKK
jgi:hypothetical protein